MDKITIVLVFLSMVAEAGEVVPPSDFGKLSVADAEKAVTARNVTDGLLIQYAAAAIESKRPELYTFCAEDGHISVAFDVAVAKLPDSRYKEDLMLLLLRTPSFLWLRLDMVQPLTLLLIDKPQSPFRALVAKYLPETKFDEMVAARPFRLALAKEIEASRAEKEKSR